MVSKKPLFDECSEDLLNEQELPLWMETDTLYIYDGSQLSSDQVADKIIPGSNMTVIEPI